MSAVTTEMLVIVPAKGRHFHLEDDCASLWQGWMNSVKAGCDTWATDEMPMDEAEAMGKFACKRCFKRAGMVVPNELNAEFVKRARRAARLARKIA